MDLYLVKKAVKKIEIRKALNKTENSINFTLPNIPVVLTPVEQCAEANKFKSCLLKMLGKVVGIPPNNYTQNLGVLARVETTEKEETLQNLYFYFPKLSQNNNNNIMEDMWSCFGKDNIKFHLNISLSSLPTEAKAGALIQPLITLKELDRMEFNSENLGYFTVESSIVQPLKQLREQETGLIYCKFTLAVTLNEVVVEQVNLFSVESSELLDHNRKLLEEEIFTDLEIECESGKMIKCHKAIVARESQIIQTV